MRASKTTFVRVLWPVLVCVSAGLAGCDPLEGDLLEDFLRQTQKQDRPSKPPPPDAPRGDAFAWKAASFDYARDQESCDGPSFVRFDGRYGLHVGVVTCGHGRVRVYLSNDGGRFLPAADTAGHGQDHCELVNPAFRIGHEDDITSGGCATCSTGRNLPLEGAEVFARANYGEPFRYVPKSPFWSHQVSQLACGVDVGGEAARAAAQVDVACEGGYPLSGFSLPPATPDPRHPEVHVLGVYETRSDHAFDYHPRGQAVVRFARTAPSVLVLASYEPTDWTVELAPGAQLQKIVLTGYHRQNVDLIGKVQVEIHTLSEGDEAPYAYQHPSPEADELLRFAAERAGAKPVSFHGCYRATKLSVR